MGRRVQHRGADGSVRDFAFSPVGLLAQVVDDVVPVVRLWNDSYASKANGLDKLLDSSTLVDKEGYVSLELLAPTKRKYGVKSLTNIKKNNRVFIRLQLVVKQVIATVKT